jgi:hypothetical protein
MTAQRIEDYALLEKRTLAFLEGLAAAVSTTLVEAGAAVTDELKRGAVERVLWAVAAHLDGRHLSTLEDGRPVQSSLGFIAVGSESAFEVPFVEHEGLLCASRISLHEYVHEAVERALGLERRATPSQAGDG